MAAASEEIAVSIRPDRAATERRMKRQREYMRGLPPVPVVTRVTIKNYRSIGGCAVEL